MHILYVAIFFFFTTLSIYLLSICTFPHFCLKFSFKILFRIDIELNFYYLISNEFYLKLAAFFEAIKTLIIPIKTVYIFLLGQN